MRPIKLGNMEIPIIEVEGMDGAALVYPGAVSEVLAQSSKGEIVYVKTEIDHSKIAVLVNTPSEKGE